MDRKVELFEQTQTDREAKAAQPIEPIERMKADMSSPPTQNEVYDRVCDNCISCWEFNQKRGKFYRVKIPEQLMAGDKFVVKDDKMNFIIKCTVPPKDILRKTQFCLKCERGGGVDEIVLHWKPEGEDISTKEFKAETIVQGSRIVKDNICNIWKYLLPIPYGAMFYAMGYFGLMGGGGSCEEMEDMEWCEIIEEEDIRSMIVVDVEQWDRMENNGKRSGDSGINIV